MGVLPDRQYDEALGMAREALEFGSEPHFLGFVG